MNKEIIKALDPLNASLENLMVISFNKSTSPSYPLAVNIAKGAYGYEEIIIAGKLVHFAVLAKYREQAGRAQALIHYISGWKGVQVFASGRLVQNIWVVSTVLNCYLVASACNDWKAHCHKIIDDPYIDIPRWGGLTLTIRLSEKPQSLKEAIEIGRYVFPCTYLHSRFRFQKEHPSSPQDQIQAVAVEEGCNWCPFFEPKEYKKVGVRIEERELFS